MTGANNNGGCDESENWELNGAEQCSITSENEAGAATIVAKFVTVGDLTVEIDGSGAGEVVNSPGLLEPAPPFECKYESPGPAEEGGEPCVRQMKQFGPFIGLTVKAKAAPGSEFAGWEIIEGINLEPENEANCNGPLRCAVGTENLGEDAVLKATFDLIPPDHPLTVTKSGSAAGSGTVECKINGGSKASCPTEVKEGSEVEVIATEGTGSDPAVLSGTGSASGCAASPCSFEMLEESSVNAEFNLESFTLTTEAFGAGEVTAPGIACTEAGNGGAECEAEFAYGTNVEVTATPAALNSVGSITGSGSAKEKCGAPTPEAPVTCEFEIKATSGVSAEFVAAESIESKPANVHGFTPQNTTLEFVKDKEGNDCGDVDLGIFLANAQEDVTYAKTCGLIVTATGAENVLSAEDESETSTGHLVNAGYELTQPLETQAEGLPGLLFPGEGGGTLASLEEAVDLLTYGGPVNSDNVTLEFSQLIKEHDPLYTGEYAKQITLTLEQTKL
jgi:hypothetical protein